MDYNTARSMHFVNLFHVSKLNEAFACIFQAAKMTKTFPFSTFILKSHSVFLTISLLGFLFNCIENHILVLFLVLLLLPEIAFFN